MRADSGRLLQMASANCERVAENAIRPLPATVILTVRCRANRDAARHFVLEIVTSRQEAARYSPYTIGQLQSAIIIL